MKEYCYQISIYAAISIIATYQVSDQEHLTNEIMIAWKALWALLKVNKALYKCNHYYYYVWSSKRRQRRQLLGDAPRPQNELRAGYGFKEGLLLEANCLWAVTNHHSWPNVWRVFWDKGRNTGLYRWHPADDTSGLAAHCCVSIQYNSSMASSRLKLCCGRSFACDIPLDHHKTSIMPFWSLS